MSNKIKTGHNIKQPRFDTILKLSEIKDYLSSQDLITLSLSCKQIRKLLSPEIFSSFNFKKFAIIGKYKKERISKEDSEYKEIKKLFSQSRDNGDGANTRDDDNKDSFYIDSENSDKYESSIKELNSEVKDYDSCEYFIEREEDYTLYIRNPYRPLPESYLESKAKFQSDLMQIPYQPTKLNIFDIGDYYYLLYDLDSVISNLQSLIVKDSTIQFEAFQYLLDSLKKLVVVELTGCYLKMQELYKNNYTINWPLHMKKLVIENNLVCFARYDDDYIATDGFGSFEFEPIYLTLEPKRLLNLHALCIEARDPRFAFGAGYGGKYLEFLEANSHVKKLEIGFDSFIPKIFEIISKFSNLTELYLSIEEVRNIDDYKYIKSPTLLNLKKLSLTLYHSLTILPIVANQFPNLTSLSLITKFHDLEELKLLPSKVQKFKNLDLKLKIFAECSLKNLNISNLNLKSLEILWRQLDAMEEFVKNVKNCPNLKGVRFNVNKFEERELSPELKLELSEAQRLLPFPHRISFNKLN